VEICFSPHWAWYKSNRENSELNFIAYRFQPLHPDTKLDRKDKLPVINEVTYLIIIMEFMRMGPRIMVDIRFLEQIFGKTGKDRFTFLIMIIMY